MFDFLKNRPDDIKGIRAALLDFIKEQLQKTDGGEGANVKGLTLYITCDVTERSLYEGAVYADEENRFKEEDVQKIADDYALSLPANWSLEIVFTQEVPDEAVRAQQVKAALFIATRKRPGVAISTTAKINVLNGDTEQSVYHINANAGKLNIGRSRKTIIADGSLRENHLAFVENSGNMANRSVSRQHAHIRWDASAAAFFLFADEGGIPPNNKVKVRTKDAVPVKLQSTEIGYRLKDGDQIIIGESALLEFVYE